MENEIKIQFALPNLESMQDCLVNPPADWQQKICGKLQELVMDYLNSNHLTIKAQLADYAVCESGWQYADKLAEMQVASIVSSYFDIYYAQDSNH